MKKSDADWYGSRVVLFATERAVTLLAAPTQDEVVEWLRKAARGKKNAWGPSSAAKWLCKQEEVDGWVSEEGIVMLCNPPVVFVSDAGPGRR